MFSRVQTGKMLLLKWLSNHSGGTGVAHAATGAGLAGRPLLAEGRCRPASPAPASPGAPSRARVQVGQGGRAVVGAGEEQRHLTNASRKAMERNHTHDEHFMVCAPGAELSGQAQAGLTTAHCFPSPSLSLQRSRVLWHHVEHARRAPGETAAGARTCARRCQKGLAAAVAPVPGAGPTRGFISSVLPLAGPQRLCCFRSPGKGSVHPSPLVPWGCWLPALGVPLFSGKKQSSLQHSGSLWFMSRC